MSSNIKKISIVQENAANAHAAVRASKPILERLSRNTAIAGLVLLTIVGIRTAAAPDGDTLLHALQTAVQSEWDENLGRLSYVSSSIGESMQVFSGQKNAYQLTSPVSAQPSNAYSSEEPYLRYCYTGDIYAAAPGEVSAIMHDDNERYIVRILHADALECVYYGLDSCYVQEGDEVSMQTVLGHSAQDFVFQAYRLGKAIDCTALLAARAL